MNNAHTAFVEEMTTLLRHFNDQELHEFLTLTIDLVFDYAKGYELGGKIYLVLDNSIIQDFKHCGSRPKRKLRAYAYMAFCRFVAGWSDRETHIAIPPVAVYEHLGLRSAHTPDAAHAAMSELQRLLSATGMNVYLMTRESSSGLDLMHVLQNIERDAKFLTEYVKAIDASDWKVGLKTPSGVRIPLSIADSVIPGNLSLRYFDPWYVKFALASRIEQLIIDQSRHDPEAQPIGSGRLSQTLAELNAFKRGILTGLGDIDLFQICDVCRQYQNKKTTDIVLLGQTFDRDLKLILRLRHTLVEGRSVESGHPNTEEQIREAVRFISSKPFAEHDKRRKLLEPHVSAFLKALGSACQQVLDQRQPQRGP
jgi:hypothetical protein